MARTLIVGAGGFGREVYWWMQSHSNSHWARSFAGFIDDDRHVLDPYPDYAPGVVHSITDYRPLHGDQLVMAIADPQTKLQLAESLKSRGCDFATFIHSSTTIAPNARIGCGCILCPGALVSCDTILGAFVTMNVYASVGHDSQLGDGCTMSGHADVMGNARLGRAVFMGSHASVLRGVSVGDLARIAANSLVIRKVHEATTMVGVPAKKLEFIAAETSSHQRPTEQ